MISSELKHFIDDASHYASSLSERTTSLIHILLAVLDDPQLQDVMRKCDVNYLDVRQGTIDALALHLAKPTAANKPEGLSALAIYALQVAQQKADVRSAVWADVLDFVAAILEIHDNGSFDFQARLILTEAGLTVSNFAKARSAARPLGHICALPAKTRTEPVNPDPVRGIPGADAQIKNSELLPFCIDMTAAAREGKYDRSFGRAAIISGLQVVLGRRKKRSAILIGDPGVGKTSIVEELACRIVEGTVGPRLAQARLIALDVGALVGGTQYRGELENRVKALIKLLSDDPNAILFVDEIHVLVSPAHSAGVAADFLKPALASGAIRCIGATTLAEYKKYFESDAAMARRFAGLNVLEPTRDEAIELLRRSASVYAEFHGVAFPEWAFETAVDLSIRLMPERRLPDKALELLDDTASRAAISGMEDVTRELFEDCARAMSGRSAQEEDIAAAVDGMPPALAAAARAIQRNAIAADALRQTVAVVGTDQSQIKKAVKDVAYALSRTYEYLDMSDFRDTASVTALLGAPPGYVGHDNGGRLYDLVRKSPDCVLHLANVDLCHQAALAIIEECLDAGYVRDTTGRVASVARTQFVLSVTQRGAKASFGFASRSDGGNEEYGVALVDNAETVVVLGPEADIPSVAPLLEGLVATAKSRGVTMSIGDGLAEKLDLELRPSGKDWKRKYSRLVREPVLDYLVSRRKDFTLETADEGIRIRTHET